jgi:hypothetical protein
LILMRGQRSEDELRFGRSVAQIIQKQNPAVWAQVAMDQGADVVVLGEEDSPFRDGLSQ